METNMTDSAYSVTNDYVSCDELFRSLANRSGTEHWTLCFPNQFDGNGIASLYSRSSQS